MTATAAALPEPPPPGPRRGDPSPSGPVAPAGPDGPLPLRRPPAPDGPAVTRVRLMPPPAQDPAEDPVGPAPSAQGVLALDLQPHAGAPDAPGGPEPLELPPAPPRLALVRGTPSGLTENAPEVRTWALRFAQAVVEVTGGDRPVGQLQRWTSPEVYADLERRAAVLARARAGGPPARRLRPQVRTVHVCRPGPHTAEVSVHVRYGQRSRAIAARLELRHGRWTCTVLQLG